jgi:hypothetical protein
MYYIYIVQNLQKPKSSLQSVIRYSYKGVNPKILFSGEEAVELES